MSVEQIHIVRNEVNMELAVIWASKFQIMTSCNYVFYANSSGILCKIICLDIFFSVFCKTRVLFVREWQLVHAYKNPRQLLWLFASYFSTRNKSLSSRAASGLQNSPSPVRETSVSRHNEDLIEGPLHTPSILLCSVVFGGFQEGPMMARYTSHWDSCVSDGCSFSSVGLRRNNTNK